MLLVYSSQNTSAVLRVCWLCRLVSRICGTLRDGVVEMNFVFVENYHSLSVLKNYRGQRDDHNQGNGNRRGDDHYQGNNSRREDDRGRMNHNSRMNVVVWSDLDGEGEGNNGPFDVLDLNRIVDYELANTHSRVSCHYNPDSAQYYSPYVLNFCQRSKESVDGSVKTGSNLGIQDAQK